jgi:hypothetical protein
LLIFLAPEIVSAFSSVEIFIQIEKRVNEIILKDIDAYQTMLFFSPQFTGKTSLCYLLFEKLKALNQKEVYYFNLSGYNENNEKLSNYSLNFSFCEKKIVRKKDNFLASCPAPLKI